MDDKDASKYGMGNHSDYMFGNQSAEDTGNWLDEDNGEEDSYVYI